jgi:hypothetical protein
VKRSYPTIIRGIRFAAATLQAARKGALFAIGLCTGLLIGCSRPQSPALITYPGASDVSFRESAGADHLTYHVNARFPAENVIGLVSKELQKDGWKISAHDDSNPDMPSIQVAAWADVIFGSGESEQCAERWGADWRNESGDFVQYFFNYFYPMPDSPPFCNRDKLTLTDLEVDAIYAPAPVFRRDLKVLEQFKKEQMKK